MTRKTIFEETNKNWFLLLLLITAVLGIFWGAVVGVKAGELYLTIFIVSVILIFLSTLWVDRTNKSTLKEYYLNPITSNPLIAMGSYLLGWLVIIIINTIGSLTQSFSTTQFFSPLFLSSGGLNAISQSFQAGLIEHSDLGTLFYSIFVAGTIEEFVWVFALPLVFYILILGFTKTVLKGKIPFNIKDKNFYMGVAIILSSLTFVFIHQLNGSYVGSMFVIAGLFRLVTNSIVYIWGIAMSFNIGLHQGNNAIAYIEVLGFQRFVEALFTNVYGLFLVAIFVGAILYVVTRPEQFWKELKKELRFYRGA